MRFRARQTIGSEQRELSPRELPDLLCELWERHVWLDNGTTSELWELPVGGFREYAGDWGACWRVERVS